MSKLSAALRSAMLCGERVSETLIAEAAALEAENECLRGEVDQAVQCECGEFVKYPNPVSLCPECGNRFLWEPGMITASGKPVIGFDRVGGGRRGEEEKRKAAEAENERLRVDAERYRALRDRQPSICIGCNEVAVRHGYTAIEVTFMLEGVGMPNFAPRLDALADALRQHPADAGETIGERKEAK